MGHVIRDRIHVALQAQKPLLAAHQKHAVDASVRGVARNATFDFRGGMLENKRSAFFRVALNAGLRTVTNQFGAVGGAMRVVAVRTFHSAFGNAVMRGKRKLGLDITVTLVAEFRLRLHQLAVVQPTVLLGKLGHVEEITLGGADRFGSRVASSFDQMRGVAVVAGDSMLNVTGVAEILLIPAALMTHQTAFGILFGIPVEGED